MAKRPIVGQLRATVRSRASILLQTDVSIRLTSPASIRPDYASRFRCIGPACEDSCCTGWSVFFDREACRRFETLPPGPLKVLIEAKVSRLPPAAVDLSSARFARVELSDERVCPFLNAERLCQIQVEHGEEFLAETCAAYPRIRRTVGGVREEALTLSCPEAARLVLFAPDLLAHDGDGCDAADPEGSQAATGNTAPAHFSAIRRIVLQLATDRRYPLWQRIFLLGVLTRRLSALARGELSRPVPLVLEEFQAAIDSGTSGTLSASMQAIAADPGIQLDVVLRLAGLQLPRSHIGQRYLDTVEAFTKGIGNAPGATFAGLKASYAEAHDRWFEPFCRKHPELLENLLVHTIFRTLFPFGAKFGGEAEPNATPDNATPDMEREFALLAGQFALLRGLLIGVAGSRREAFCAEDAVRAVQSAAKHFEHHSGFLDAVGALLKESKLDTPRALTLLVRN